MTQEPIAYINVEKRTLEFAEPIKWHTPTVANIDRIPLFTQRTWVGLTKEDKDLIEDLCEMMIGDAAFSTIDAILKGKNT